MENVVEGEIKKRNVAYKIKIGDITKSKPVYNEGKFLFLEFDEKKVYRINLIANAVDKFVNDGEKKYASLSVDDASGQIKLKAFGEDISLLKDCMIGDCLQIIGVIREYNSELYILPEIVKVVDSRWLLVRKLELQKMSKEILPGNFSIRDSILEKIKKADSLGGLDKEQIILELNVSVDVANLEIKKLLEEGMIYEPRPGVLRYLG